MSEDKKTKQYKCIVWDLDNTLWDGVLLEDQEVKLKPFAANIIKELDQRGILHSIASKNNFDDAIKKLKEFDLAKYFLYPEIHWNAKSISLSKIQKNLNIGMDTILFIDDQIFEREEVKSVHPEITCMDALEYMGLLSHSGLNPRFITEDSKRRRIIYQEEIERKKDEENYEGPHEKFLSSLNMIFSISEAQENDLKRAEELTIRTNQLNSTGITYTYEELEKLRKSHGFKLLICELSDKYGSYGKIGLALVEINKTHWHIKLLLMSCRVVSRGVGSVLLSYIMSEAKAEGKKLFADFKVTDRNKMMYVAYKFNHFKEIHKEDKETILLENDLSIINEIPDYIKIKSL